MTDLIEAQRAYRAEIGRLEAERDEWKSEAQALEVRFVDDRARIDLLEATLGKAYQFISPLSDPMGITNKSMADEIMAALAGKVQP